MWLREWAMHGGGSWKVRGGGSSGETTCLTQAKGLGGLEFAGWEMEGDSEMSP